MKFLFRKIIAKFPIFRDQLVYFFVNHFIQRVGIEKKIAMSRMDLETPKEVVAPDDMTAADYYFDSYAHFGKELS